ncbi:MAG: hypothetical protein HQL35_01145, partial [Alphaproteobacteria bacterium]|nr:hypothetical protein [Alphaproteobacteria bacterium]
MTDATNPDATNPKGQGPRWIRWGVLIMAVLMLAGLPVLATTAAYKAIIAAGAVVAAFLAFYDEIKTKGKSFLCNLSKLMGGNLFSDLCKDAPADRLAQIKALKDNHGGVLDPDKLAKLESLEKALAGQVRDALLGAGEAKGLAPDPTGPDTCAVALDAVTHADDAARKALARIADGDIQGGFNALIEQAERSTDDTARHWRRIGELAYGLDTARAIAAFEKLEDMDRLEIWDAIYLCRSYVQAGNLTMAEDILKGAIAALPEGEETLRDRGVLLDESASLHIAQGNLDLALSNYRETHAIMQQLANADTDSLERQRDLSVSHD